MEKLNKSIKSELLMDKINLFMSNLKDSEERKKAHYDLLINEVFSWRVYETEYKYEDGKIVGIKKERLQLISNRFSEVIEDKWVEVTDKWRVIKGEYDFVDDSCDTVLAKYAYLDKNGIIAKSELKQVSGEWEMDEAEWDLSMEVIAEKHILVDINRVLLKSQWWDCVNDCEILGPGVEDKELEVGLFKIQSANHWINQAKHTKIPRMLFSELWHENELCILFADTNVGKSILAVQIGDSISKGQPLEGFKLEAENQPILYFDFELTAKQFESRYSERNNELMEFEKHYKFDNQFKRVEINVDADIPDKIDFEDYLITSLESSAVSTGSKVLIIDNITYLNNENEKAKDALPLMKRLKRLKDKHDLSMLILAHTPKRDGSKPLTKNDLQGSKMLINFCDSCFAIGESQTDSALKYIKQLKARNTEVVYGSDNVVICQINKPHNFLGFELISFGDEQEHLRIYSKEDRESRIAQAYELINQGMSKVRIAKQLGVSEGAIRKWLKKVNQ